MENDMDKRMEEMGIEDVTGDKAAELEAEISSRAYFDVKDDHDAIRAIYKILADMQLEMKIGRNQYFDIAIQQKLFNLKKYLENT